MTRAQLERIAGNSNYVPAVRLAAMKALEKADSGERLRRTVERAVSDALRKVRCES